MTPTDQSYREIPLTRGKVTLVDDSDYESLSQFNWHVRNHGRVNDKFYAVRNMPRANGKRQTITMHRQILELLSGIKEVDHINGNSLDNRRSNLRVCDRWQNNCNSPRSSALGLRGVYEREGGYASYIRAGGKRIYLGYFREKVDAHKAYCDAAKQYHGEFANFAARVQAASAKEHNGN